jgi:hypothetical protein
LREADRRRCRDHAAAVFAFSVGSNQASEGAKVVVNLFCLLTISLPSQREADPNQNRREEPSKRF